MGDFQSTERNRGVSVKVDEGTYRKMMERWGKFGIRVSQQIRLMADYFDGDFPKLFREADK